MAIHPTAVIHPSAVVADDVEIGPGVFIGANVEIGPECELMSGAVVCANTRMGRGNRVHYHAVLGNDPQFLGFDPATKSGLVIGDNNTFRELCTVHRGLKDGLNTVIGNNNFLMATAHIGHDCVLGNHIVVANATQVSGHVEIGDRAFLSGLCAVHQFCRIGRGVMLGGMSGIGKDVPPFLTTRGDFGFLVGVNVVGLRRAGVSAAARTALRQAFRELFLGGLALPKALARLREQWSGSAEPMPAELAELLAFCEVRSKRGILSAISRSSGRRSGVEDDDADIE